MGKVLGGGGGSVKALASKSKFGKFSNKKKKNPRNLIFCTGFMVYIAYILIFFSTF